RRASPLRRRPSIERAPVSTAVRQRSPSWSARGRSSARARNSEALGQSGGPGRASEVVPNARACVQPDRRALAVLELVFEQTGDLDEGIERHLLEIEQ